MKKSLRQAAWVILLLLALLTLGLGVAQAAPPEGQPVVHVVQWGDTLESIAARYGTTVWAISQANSLADPQWIYAGQRLTIPSTGAAASGNVYVVQAGDTLGGIAARYGTTVQAIAQANGIANVQFIYAGQRLSITGSSASAYTVRAGDTLEAIAARFGTTSWAIARANGLSDPSLIFIGQSLVIPRGGGYAASPSAPTGGKWIEVDISQQRAWAWQGQTLVYSFIVSTGLPAYPTRTGRFQVKTKLPVAYGLGLKYYYWLGIYDAGPLENGFHALPINLSTGQTLWAGYLGRRVSFGCIVLGTYDAQVLYNWTELGTPVVIHD
jgi:LysM repeat protein